MVICVRSMSSFINFFGLLVYYFIEINLFFKVKIIFLDRVVSDFYSEFGFSVDFFSC